MINRAHDILTINSGLIIDLEQSIWYSFLTNQSMGYNFERVVPCDLFFKNIAHFIHKKLVD